MENEEQIRQIIINALWSYDELSEKEVYDITNKIIKALKN